MSLRVEVEEEGVMVGEFWLFEPLLGDAVPSFESFFLEDLPESFPRESCRRRALACASGNLTWRVRRTRYRSATRSDNSERGRGDLRLSG